jgi:copper resistance protein B
MTGRWLTFAVAAGFVVAANAARAQVHPAEASEAAPFGSPIEDRQIYVHGLLDQFEGRIGGDKSFRYEGQAWAGTDRNRLWFKSEGEVTGSGRFEDGIHEALYDRPISPYFDLQAGIRYDIDSDPSRGWAALGIQGLAPQWFDVEATAYVSDAGHLAARLRSSYELLLTQRLILEPEVELNVYSKSDPDRAIGRGLSELDTGLRLRYEVTRKFAPYIGVAYDKKFGSTASFARQEGESAEDVRFVFGIRSWF